MLRLNNISFSYEPGTLFEKKAVSNVNLEIKDGSFLGITGRTGSGKTTLAMIIAGLTKPTSGSLYSSGEKVGIVFQFPEDQLFEETVIKDVMFGPLNIGCTNTEAEAKAHLAMEIVGLDDSYYDRSPFSLSDGEKRRAAIAGVLATDPDIIIMDEPGAGLDNRNHDKIFSILKKLNNDGNTVIVISHDMNDIGLYCSDVVLLENGQIKFKGKPAELTDSKNGNREFASDVSNLANRLRQEGINIPFGVTKASDIVEQLSKFNKTKDILKIN